MSTENETPENQVPEVVAIRLEQILITQLDFLHTEIKKGSTATVAVDVNSLYRAMLTLVDLARQFLEKEGEENTQAGHVLMHRAVAIGPLCFVNSETDQVQVYDDREPPPENDVPLRLH